MNALTIVAVAASANVEMLPLLLPLLLLLLLFLLLPLSAAIEF